MKILLVSTILFYTVISVGPNGRGDCHYTMSVNRGYTVDTIKFDDQCVWDVGDTFSTVSEIDSI